MMPNNKVGESHLAHSYKVFQNGKEIYNFISRLYNKIAYGSNVVYYTTTEDVFIKTYDLKSEKEL